MTPKKALYLREIGFPGGTVVKNLPVNAEDRVLIPGLGRSHVLGQPRLGATTIEPVH